jgi:hypothetical protein
MIRKILTVFLLFIFPAISFSQIVTYSEALKDDIKNTNFEIVGKVSGNILVFRNNRSDYAIAVYDNQMKLKELVPLDFLPEKTFNVNFIAYPDFIYLIYQYQIKKAVYCAAVKLDAEAKVINQPIGLDTTEIGSHSNKIYTTVNSEDKQKILLVKALKQNTSLTIATILLDNNLQIIKKTRQDLAFNDSKSIYDNFLVDNDGDLAFNISAKASGKEYFDQLELITKPALADTFTINNIDLKGRYTNDIFIKADNLNKHYIINTLFYIEKKGDAQGLYANIWDKQSNNSFSNVYITFGDSVKMALKNTSRVKEVLNDFIIKNVVVKKDGGYILMAEDCSVDQSNGNGVNHYNRWDYFYNSMYMSPFGYNPNYYNPYNPYGFNNIQTTTYNYKNVFVVSIDKYGKPEWNNAIYKDQSSDNDDNALSFGTFTTGGEIHLLFNELVKRTLVLSDNSITADGNTNKNAQINPDKGYNFLPRFGKQVGAKQFVTLCSYRGSVCFAKIEY